MSRQSGTNKGWSRSTYLGRIRFSCKRQGGGMYPILSWKGVFIKNHMPADDCLLGERIIAFVASIVGTIS
jgi:hypothetical protein